MIIVVEPYLQKVYNYFEEIEDYEVIEPIVRKTKKPKKEEVEENGDIESTNEDLGS